MDAEIVASVPIGIIPTTDTSKEFDGRNVKADLTSRLNIPDVRNMRPSSAPGIPSVC